MSATDIIRFNNRMKIFYNSDINHITFTAPFDGWLYIEVNVNGWGYAGGEMSLGINQQNEDISRLTKVHEFISTVKGGDTQPRLLQPSAIFTNMIKDESYTILAYAINGTDKIGGLRNYRHRVFCVSGQIYMEEVDN